ITWQRGQFGSSTIIIVRVAFNVSNVAIDVRARLTGLDARVEDPARVLCAHDESTLLTIPCPLILPGRILAELAALTLSLDAFVIPFFPSGVGTTTLPVFVYGLLKLSVTPEINEISTLILVASTLLIGVSLLLQGRPATRV